MNLIIRSFRKLGLSLPIDGQRDTEQDIKGRPGIQVGNWMDDTTTDEIYMDMGTEDNEHSAIEYVADSERSMYICIVDSIYRRKKFDICHRPSWARMAGHTSELTEILQYTDRIPGRLYGERTICI